MKTFAEILEEEAQARGTQGKEKTAEELEAERLAAEASANEAEEQRLAEEEAARLAVEAEGGEEKTADEIEAERLAAEEAAKNAPKSFLEAVGNPIVKKEEVVIPDSVKETISKLEAANKALASKLDLIENDPLVKAVTAEATKEQLVAIAAELNGKDYSKSSYKDLLEAEIKAEGFEGDELAEQLEAEMSNFEALLPYQRNKLEKEIRAKFQATAKKGESPTLQALEDAFLAKNSGLKTPAQLQQEDEAIIQADLAAIKQVGTSAIGSEMYGVVFTQEELNDILTKEYNPENISKQYLDEKGNLNAPKYLIDTFKLRNFDKMLENAAKTAVNKKNIEETVVKGNAKGAPVHVEKLTNAQLNMKAVGLPDYIINPKK